MEAVISPSKARRSRRPVAGGRSRLEMKNQNGVQVYLTSASKGLDVSLGRGGVEMSLKKEASSSAKEKERAGTRAARSLKRPNADLEELRDILVDVLAHAHRAHIVPAVT